MSEKMIDGHVHLEKGPLTAEYAMEFIEEACRKGIGRLQILDHTHRFKEFEPLYEDMLCIEPQRAWLSTHFVSALDEYYELIAELKKEKLPIDVRFGLEVCWMDKKEDFLRSKLSDIPLDFLVGSVHSVFDIAYDCSWSVEYLWDAFSADDIYREYYKSVFNCIKSGLFTQLGHPDTIKMFSRFPGYDLTSTYHELAELLNRYGVLAENNTGAYYRYNYPEIGLSDELLDILKEHDCRMITVSDAHKPGDCGNYIADIWEKTFE